MSELFSCYKEDINYETNEKIDWDDHRNDITQWNTSNVTDMVGMFEESTFNQPISNWDVSSVTDMAYMFHESKFNQPIGNWNVSNVTNMYAMFFSSKFNQPLNNWDVSNVIVMKNLFAYSSFNQPIGHWNISNVTDMNNIFYNSPFNQNISKWIFTLNRNCYLDNFNKESFHEKKFGNIDSYKDFIKIHLTKNFINNILQNGSDKDKFKLLKIIKKYPDIVKNIDIGRKL